MMHVNPTNLTATQQAPGKVSLLRFARDGTVSLRFEGCEVNAKNLHTGPMTVTFCGVAFFMLALPDGTFELSTSHPTTVVPHLMPVRWVDRLKHLLRLT